MFIRNIYKSKDSLFQVTKISMHLRTYYVTNPQKSTEYGHNYDKAHDFREIKPKENFLSSMRLNRKAELVLYSSSSESSISYAIHFSRM